MEVTGGRKQEAGGRSKELIIDYSDIGEVLAIDINLKSQIVNKQ